MNNIIQFLQNNWLSLIQIIVAIALIIAILLQHRGTSLGGAFGGSSNVYRSRRGVEKLLFTSTIVLAAIFIIVSIANLLIR